MSRRTRVIASEIVNCLQEELSALPPRDLPGVRALFVYGSFVRGDWLDCNSDLDLGVLLASGASPDSSAGYQKIQEAARRTLAGRAFGSHTPGGIDWCTLSSFPTRDEQAREITGFFPFSIFLFDFLQHSDVLWGEDFRRQMPRPPEPRSLAAECLDAILTRLAQLDGPDVLRLRAPFNAYKAVLVAQLAFGERTVEKTRILHLYQRNVPKFPMKADGEKLIRQYVGAIYPEWVPRMQDPPYYQQLIDELRQLVAGKG